MILLTGGSGLLGKELQKHIECFAPSRKDGWDITKRLGDIYFIRNAIKKIKLIVHCAAFTDLVRAEKEKQLCYDTNVIGTSNLARLGIPMLYISTEYVFDGEKGDYRETDYADPVNFYAKTKLWGEYESRRTRSVVTRCLFKPRPFKHEFACHDQYTSGAYVDRVAKEIARASQIFDRLPETLHIGFGRRSTFELARESRPDVKPISVDEINTVKLPKDTSLDCSLWNRIKKENNID